jgi:hypothetical protein
MVMKYTETMLAAHLALMVGPLPPMQLWHSCTATACGFHACMVSQSIYTPQLQTWATQFSHRQMHVLTLNGFAASPAASLQRVTRFLG